MGSPEHVLEQEGTWIEMVVQSIEVVAPLASHNSGNQSWVSTTSARMNVHR